MPIMSFLENPMLYHHVLERTGILNELYQAVSNMDMSAAVLAAINVMRITETTPCMMPVEKTSQRSTTYRMEGNSHLNERRYQMALICYNKALLHAPEGSMELVQAYNNRSALLLKVSSYAASLNDIETCLRLTCTEDLLQKLKTRKEICMANIFDEQFQTDLLVRGFRGDFFKFNVKRHPQIPCLSADVDVITESGHKKVVAATDIHVGAVVAVERAFITYSSNKSLWSCYYCQSVSFNLMPCDNCCFALFCSDKCKNLCLKEYHSEECHIMEVLAGLGVVGYKFRLTVKTVLKLKMLCKQWSTLIKESKNIGTSRLKTSSVDKIYDVNNYSSILSFEGWRHFIFGSIYNSCFVYATVIHYLEKIPGFFPVSPVDCLEAKKCLARLFLTLELNWPYFTEIENMIEETRAKKMKISVPNHYGWFSFTGKLKHSCDPNVLVLGLTNRVALVAVKPIKKNMELNISYVGHWYENSYKNDRPIKLYLATLDICSCRICKESWDANEFQRSSLNKHQLKEFSVWDEKRKRLKDFPREPSFYMETCKLLEWFHDQLNTKEHLLLFRELRLQLSLYQYAESKNYSE